MLLKNRRQRDMWWWLSALIGATLILLAESADSCFQVFAIQEVPIQEKAIADSLIGEQYLRHVAQSGFPDEDGDGVERFRLTVICNCVSEAALQAGRFAAKGGVMEVPCTGFLADSPVSYNLAGNVGTCFVASQQESKISMHSLSPFFLRILPDAKAVPPELMQHSREGMLRPADVYLTKGEFELGGLGYWDICNQDAPPLNKLFTGVSGPKSFSVESEIQGALPKVAPLLPFV